MDTYTKLPENLYMNTWKPTLISLYLPQTLSTDHSFVLVRALGLGMKT